MRCKYIVLQPPSGLPLPVLFSEGMKHKDFKDLGEIVSAGMVDIVGGAVICHGESQSLGLKPNLPHDESLIRVMMQVGK